MEKFSTNEFFNLSLFHHRKIFEGSQYAWEALLLLKDFLDDIQLGQIESPIPQDAHVVNPELVSIGKNTIIEPGAYIQGPCIIGDECELRHGTYIRGYILAGDRCVFGHSSEFKHSILLDDVSAAHFNYVGDSILGNGVNLGAGVKLANLRFDHKPIHVDYRDGKISTGLKKLGAVIGDGAQLGCNAVTNPGTFIGKGIVCRPCVPIKGYVPQKFKSKNNESKLCR